MRRVVTCTNFCRSIFSINSVTLGSNLPFTNELVSTWQHFPLSKQFCTYFIMWLTVPQKFCGGRAVGLQNRKPSMYWVMFRASRFDLCYCGACWLNQYNSPTLYMRNDVSSHNIKRTANLVIHMLNIREERWLTVSRTFLHSHTQIGVVSTDPFVLPWQSMMDEMTFRSRDHWMKWAHGSSFMHNCKVRDSKMSVNRADV